MRSKIILSLISILTAHSAFAKYEAHEWGTFTSVVDSAGITQNGLYHEDEELPQFVHGFGELRKELPTTPPGPPFFPPNPPRPCRNIKICFDMNDFANNTITQKMETPVIYFYSDIPQKVDVNVEFPEGVITETYPGPVETFPTMQDSHIIANGKTKFSVNVLAAKQGAVPLVDKNNIYAHARNVDSNLISSGAEQEKFIFYRGLGRFQPKISITSQNGVLKISDLKNFRPQMAVLIHVDGKGDGQMLSLDSVKTKDEVKVSARHIAQLKNHDSVTSPFIIKGEQARGKLIDELTVSGLFKDEAIAMVNTWESGYLKVPGLRLLYILPTAEVEQVLPLTMSPLPEKLVRSFVGRMEILLDTEEQKILADIKNEQDRFQVESLGRFAEPVLHRVRELAQKTESENSSLLNLIDGFIEKAKVGFESGVAVH